MRVTIRILVVAFCLASVPPAFAGFIDPADARGIRKDTGMDPILLGGLVVKKGNFFEDRTVLEFPLAPFGATVPPTTLEVFGRNLDPFFATGVLDVFVFVADGVVTTDDFFQGGPAPDFQHETVGVLFQTSMDVTAEIQALVDAGESYIGFRLSTETLDRYNIGAFGGVPEPRLNLIPEPFTLLLLPAAATLLPRRKSKRT